jgi:hypothetical protein
MTALSSSGAGTSFGAKTATLLSNGSVLLTGGDGTAEVYTPTVSGSNLVLSRIVPAVASGGGAFGSFFRTSLQVRNTASTATLHGRLTFRQQGETTPFSSDFAIPPNGAIFYTDVVAALGGSGIGTLDILTDAQLAVPPVVAHVYNTVPTGGTTGFVETASKPSEFLQAGETALFFAPLEPENYRLNVGVRVLDQGATVTFNAVSADGTVIAHVVRQYTPNQFEQVGSSSLFGVALPANCTIEVAVSGGGCSRVRSDDEQRHERSCDASCPANHETVTKAFVPR